MEQIKQDVYPYVSVNLETKPQESLGFPYLDMGFLYGYGLFESILVKEGRPRLIRDHCTRLRRSSLMLDININWDQDAICEAVDVLIKKNKAKEAVLNIYLSAGNRSGLLVKKSEQKPMLLMVLRPYEKESLKDGIKLDVKQESFQRTPLDCLKTMAWMKNWLELRFSEEDYDDVLLYDADNYILETALANLFFIKGQQVITPKSNCVLTGVTRQFLLNNQDKLNIEIILRPVTLSELNDFDEIFLTNALRGVVSIQHVKGYPQLKSKHLTLRIAEGYQKLIS
ncbi:MAG: aminotransferase class IV [bacterium]